MTATSIPQAFLDRVATAPSSPALVVWNNDNTQVALTAEELLLNVRTTAARLTRQGLESGQVIILALDHSPKLVITFMACLFVGAQPVIHSYPSSISEADDFVDQLLDLVSNAAANAVVTEPALERKLGRLLTGQPCRLLSSLGVVTDRQCTDVIETFGQGEDIAYLQYTSGSTGRRKGVMLSHRAVLANVRAMTSAFEITSRDVFATWLPLYHDFGLVLGLLTPLLTGGNVVLMSPTKWVRRPGLLLEAIHEYRATATCLPNFALIHMTRTVRATTLKNYDLSCVRLINWGSEPCRPASRQAFLNHFSVSGLAPAVLTAGYGMAEQTLCIASTRVHEPTRTRTLNTPAHVSAPGVQQTDSSEDGARCYVSCGTPLPETEIRVVDDNGISLPDQSVGEIIARSSSMFSGYHRRPDLTANAIRNGWYHTGDLGFFADGELYFCDRRSDLVIVGGNNIHPADVEAVAQQIPGVRPHGVVAFGIPSERTGTEMLALACELSRKTPDEQRREIEATLRRGVLRAVGVALTHVFFVPRGQLKKTANGKLARSLNRKEFASRAA